MKRTTRFFSMLTLGIIIVSMIASCTSSKQVSCPTFKDKKQTNAFAFNKHKKQIKKKQKSKKDKTRLAFNLSKKQKAPQPIVVKQNRTVNEVATLQAISSTTITANVSTPQQPIKEVQAWVNPLPNRLDYALAQVEVEDALIVESGETASAKSVAPQVPSPSIPQLSSSSVSSARIVTTPELPKASVTPARIASVPKHSLPVSSPVVASPDHSLTASTTSTPIANAAADIVEYLAPPPAANASKKEIKKAVRKQKRVEKLAVKAEKKFDKMIDKQMKGKFPDQGEGKSQLIALVLLLFLGGFAAHRFYLGYIGIAIAQILTLGGCGIWLIIDLVRIITGDLQPKDGPYGKTLDDY